MATPRRRSARLASASATKVKSTPGLESVSEHTEAPNLTPKANRHEGPFSPTQIPSTPASSAMKPPHDEMHPSKAHQTMAKPSSALRLGFADVKEVGKPGGPDPMTPSKIAVPNSNFTFRCTHEGTDTDLSSDAQRLMQELREQASRIKADMVAQREAEAEANEALERKIAKPKGKSSRYSAAHMAEFKKMDSIENHASAWRAQNGRFTPVVSKLRQSPSKSSLQTTPTSQIKSGLKRSPSKADLDSPATPRMKPAMKRKSEAANLDEIQQSPSPKKVAPLPTVSKLRFPGRTEEGASSKRFKQRLEDDASSARPVSRDGTSIPRPASSGLGTGRRLPPTGAPNRLLSPTKASLAHVAAKGKATVSLVKSPSKPDLATSLKSPSVSSLASAAKSMTPRARIVSPGRFERVKSILRGSRTASGNVQTAIPQPAVSQTPGPSRTEKALPPLPLTTPRRKLTKHVAFTPEVTRIAAEPNSPSPQKSVAKARVSREPEDPKAEAKSGDVTYPDLSGFRPLPEPLAKGLGSPSVPGTFTFRSDHTIEFGASPQGFGAELGQSSLRHVRPSFKPSTEMPGAFPSLASSTSSHPNKENKAPTPGKLLFGAPHGMTNKKRHRATWDEEESELDDTDRASKKRKNEHVPEGEALLAPRLTASTPKSSAKKSRLGQALSRTPGTPGSASPTKKRGGLSLSRLNMLARPKNRA